MCLSSELILYGANLYNAVGYVMQIDQTRQSRKDFVAAGCVSCDYNICSI